ncbi:MAG: hypothetical protein NVS4B11_01580 [Ktedonobacteraceae bacterium]
MSSLHTTPRLQRKRPVPWLAGGIVFLSLSMLATLIFFPGASLLNHMSWLDSGICAQIASHSFYPGGEQLPLCARNTGIYLGFLVTLTTLYGKGRGRAQQLPPWPLFVLLIGGVMALAVDGFNSFLLDLGVQHLYQPNNLLRLATGLVTGLAMALLLLPILNRLFWRGYDENRSVTSWQELIHHLPGLIVCFFVVASQNALILYPIALLSTVGILIALGSLNLIALVGMSRRDETFEHYRELLPFLGVALLLAIGEMLLLAQLKLTLLHTIGL